MPRNAVTGHVYSGKNIDRLVAAQDQGGYTDALWLTFRQALVLGGNVRKGEHGVRILKAGQFAASPETAAADAAAAKDGLTPVRGRRSFARGYTVFNVAQCKNLQVVASQAVAVAPGEAGFNVGAWLDGADDESPPEAA